MAWKYFTLEQFGRSSTAKARGIDNTPKAEYYNHVDELVQTLLDPLREAWGSNILITSGYRCSELNKVVGGSKTSAHCYAYAADMSPANGKIEEFKAFVLKWLYENNYKFDQYINEYSGRSSWVHLAVKSSTGLQRKQYMLYQNDRYTSINPATFQGVSTSSQASYQTAQSSEYVTQSSNWTSSTSNVGYGILTGKSVYLNDIDIEQIQNNDVFVKSDDGTPLIDSETGEYMVTDEYLLGMDESLIDEISDIDEIPKEPDAGMDDFFDNITSGTQEKVSGISYNADGSYVVEQSMTLREYMRMIWEWIELVEILKQSVETFNQNKVSASKVEEEHTQYTYNIDLEAHAKQAFDKFGHIIRNGITCPICGRTLKYMPLGGYCSTECMLRGLENKVFTYLMSPNDRYADFIKILNDLCALLDYMTLLINALICIPDIIRELAHLPERYKRYVQAKICECFYELQKLIKMALKKKNEIVAKFLRKIHLGVILKPFAYIYSAIQVVIEALEKAKEAFDIGYNTALTALTALNVSGGSINAESFAWCCTPRSYISPMPYTCPDVGKIFVNLPGGSGMQNIQLAKPLMPSGLCTINYAAIETAIQSLFPPLTVADYYLEPELFEVRFLFSDQSDLVAQIRQQLTDFLSGGPDYMPSYENLFPVKKYTNMTIDGVTVPEVWLPNIGYIWFLLGLADAWAPHSQSLVGSMTNPAV